MGHGVDRTHTRAPRVRVGGGVMAIIEEPKQGRKYQVQLSQSGLLISIGDVSGEEPSDGSVVISRFAWDGIVEAVKGLLYEALVDAQIRTAANYDEGD